MGFFRQGYWSRLPFPPPGDLFWPRDWTRVFCVSCLAGRFFTAEPLGKPYRDLAREIRQEKEMKGIQRVKEEVQLFQSIDDRILYISLSVQFSRSVVSNSLQPHEPQHARPPCSSPTPGIYSNSCPLSQWCHPTISFSVIPFSSHFQSFPASGSFQMSQLFESGCQSIGVSASASVLPMNIQDWFPLGWTGWISL